MKPGEGKILYTGVFEWPDKNAAALRALGNAKALRALGYEVILLGVSRDRTANHDIHSSRLTVDGFDTWSVPYPGSFREWINHLQSIRGLKEMLREAGDIGVIIGYNYPAMALQKAIWFCRRHKIRLLADSTEWYEAADVTWQHRLPKVADTFYRMRILQKRLAGLLVISTYLERYYAGNRNVVRVPPLIDRSDSKWQTCSTVMMNRPESEDRRIRLICSSGTLGGKNKDTVDGLLEALRRFPVKAFSLQVVGMTQADYLKDYPGHGPLLESLGDTIEWVGKIAHLDNIDLMKQADFSVILRNPSRKNNAGFPTKFVESLACGTPVLTTDTSDLRMYLVDGQNGFWTANTPEALLETLNRLASLNTADIQQMKEACRRTASFDYRQYLDQFSCLMEQI